MSENKYKMFRNYMVNELGISKQDIEAWTKEAVSAEVKKLTGQIDIDSLIETQIKRVVREALTGSHFGSGSTELAKAIAKELAPKFCVTYEQ